VPVCRGDSIDARSDADNGSSQLARRREPHFIPVTATDSVCMSLLLETGASDAPAPSDVFATARH